MEYLQITKQNIDGQHICCALGAKQYEAAVNEKKSWLKERMDEGLVFYRLDDRAKVFIEYLPADQAWAPVDAPNYMFINCLWVSGRHKGQGHAGRLLERCKEDAAARGMDGIVHIVGNKKLPYLSDKAFFQHMGFKAADEAQPYFQLMALTWSKSAAAPTFKPHGKQASVPEKGISIYYTAQCPFAVGMLEELQSAARFKGVPFRACRITSKEQAQQAPAVWTTFALYYDGKFVTHEILSVNKFDKLLERLLQA
ncbi:GNAT family N-acetyltransferase [Paenibacillus sp. TH7-28]